MKKMLLVGLCAMACAGCDFSWKTAHFVAQHVLDTASGIDGLNSVVKGLFGTTLLY